MATKNIDKKEIATKATKATKKKNSFIFNFESNTHFDKEPGELLVNVRQGSFEKALKDNKMTKKYNEVKKFEKAYDEALVKHVVKAVDAFDEVAMEMVTRVTGTAYDNTRDITMSSDVTVTDGKASIKSSLVIEDPIMKATNLPKKLSDELSEISWEV